MARNKYPGICYRCNKLVPKGEGHFEKGYTGHIGMTHWRVQHTQCAIKYRNSSTKKGSQ